MSRKRKNQRAAKCREKWASSTAFDRLLADERAAEAKEQRLHRPKRPQKRRNQIPAGVARTTEGFIIPADSRSRWAGYSIRDLPADRLRQFWAAHNGHDGPMHETLRREACRELIRRGMFGPWDDSDDAKSVYREIAEVSGQPTVDAEFREIVG